jgi:hypothetical protein
MTIDSTKRKGLKIEKRERATTTKGHFVVNADVLRAYRESKAQGKMTEELAKYILIIARNYTRHPWFCRYPQNIKDEMVSEAVVNLCAKWHLFDDTLSQYPNPFAYYTQACYRSFNNFKGKEKRENTGRDKLMMMNDMNPSWNEDGGDEGGFE